MSEPASRVAGSAKPKPPRKRGSGAWRIGKWLLIGLLVLIIVLLGLAAWIVGTRSGLEFAWSLIEPRLPPGIQVAGVAGRLIGPLTVTGIEIDTVSMRARVGVVELEWDAAALLSGAVHIENLALHGVDYTAKSSAPQRKENDQPFSLPEVIELPVTVQLDRFALDQVRVVTAPGAEPFVLDTLHLTGALLGETDWRVGALTAHGPMFDIDARARLVPHGRYLAELALDAELRLPDLAPIRTGLRVSGGLRRLKIEQTVAPPYNMVLHATVTGGLGATPSAMGIEANLTLADTRLRAIRADLPQVTVGTGIAVSGTRDDLSIRIDAQADSADFGQAIATADLHYSPRAVAINKLLVTSPERSGRLAAQGQVALSAGKAMDLTLNWQQLQWPLAGEPAYRSESGDLRLTGTLSDYRLHGSLGWQVVGQAAGRLQLTGHGDQDSLTLANLDIHGGPGDVSAQAKVVWAPVLAVTAHVQGDHINPGAIVPDLPGDFSLIADLRARQIDGVLTAHVETLQAHGSLRGQPLELAARAAYLGDHVVIEQLALDYGATTATAQGRLGWTPAAALDLTWAINSPDLSRLWPALAGEVHNSGTLRGTLSAPLAQAELVANHLEYDHMTVDGVRLQADVDWSGASRSQVTLDVADARVAGQVVKTLALGLTGTPAAHTLDLKLDSEAAQLALALDGALRKDSETWHFTLTDLAAAYAELAPWRLAAPASGRVSISAQEIERACLTSGDARVCLQGVHDDGVATAQVTLDDLAIAYAEPFLPDDLILDGAVSATVDARLPAGGEPRIDLHLTTTAGTVQTVQPDQQVVRVFAFEPARVDATLTDTALDAALVLPLADTGAIKAEVAVAPGRAPLTQRPLRGHVDIRIAQLDFISKLSPEVAAIDGRLVGDLRIEGTIDAPRARGALELMASRIALTTPGLALTDVRLAGTARGESIDLSASAASGGGTLSADGAVAFGPAGPAIELAIRGEGFQAVNTPDARAWVSPDLQVSVTPEAVRVSGSVAIPKARITPRNLPAAGVETVAADTVIVTGDSGAEAGISRKLVADVNVVLGDVRIEGFGLKAALTGELRVQQVPGEPPTGTGEIHVVEGEYRAYGQDLDIQDGRIIFAGGPIAEPGLELRAARYPAEDITVGVQVRGRVSKPAVTLFSDPAMPQAETLSWLLLGRPLEGTTGGQASLIARAALALGSGRANSILTSIGDKLGVDTIGIGSPVGTGASEAAFMVGEYLTPKLYLSYGLGLFDSVSTLSLRYTLSSNWSLETQTSGNATGGDLIFTFER